MSTTSHASMRLGSYLYLPVACLFTLVRKILRYKLRGQENLCAAYTAQPFLVVANHTRAIDSYIISSLLRVRVSWIADLGIHQSSYFITRLSERRERYPHIHRYIPVALQRLIIRVLSEGAAYTVRKCDTVLIDRSARPFHSSLLNKTALTKAQSDLASGKSVGVFPEGGIKNKLPEPSFFIPLVLIRRQSTTTGILQIHICHQRRLITVYPLLSRDELIKNKEGCVKIMQQRLNTQI